MHAMITEQVSSKAEHRAQMTFFPPTALHRGFAADFRELQLQHNFPYHLSPSLI